MAIYEPFIMKQILKVTCEILHNNFFYDDENIAYFLDEFTEDIAKELACFELNVDKDIAFELHTNPSARLHFTCYFTSVQLRQTFIHKLHFSTQELHAFESILPKYIGEKNSYETNSKCQGKNN